MCNDGTDTVRYDERDVSLSDVVKIGSNVSFLTYALPLLAQSFTGGTMRPLSEVRHDILSY